MTTSNSTRVKAWRFITSHAVENQTELAGTCTRLRALLHSVQVAAFDDPLVTRQATATRLTGNIPVWKLPVDRRMSVRLLPRRQTLPHLGRHGLELTAGNIQLPLVVLLFVGISSLDRTRNDRSKNTQQVQGTCGCSPGSANHDDTVADRCYQHVTNAT